MNQPVKFGKYFLLERINVGGMAEVFKAKSFGVEGFEKLIAIKRILPNIAEDEDFITMFIDEAKIAVQLNHANIAQIFDLGKIDDSFFIALEFVHGKDLRTIWERHKRRGLRMPIPMSVYVVSRVCEGLDYAHRKKDAGGRELHIVHRDVSPQNILLSYEGEVKIIDFGIAKAANKASKTQAGILKGKFGYMSPEQVRGLPLDHRSDVFSSGIILYELLTGERLFVGESDFSTLEKVRNVEILPPSTYNRNIPDSLEKIVLKALSKDPDDRFQTAYNMQEELQRFLILNKSGFARKDLASYMKRAFKSDIGRELERHKEYERIAAAPGPAVVEEPELPTNRLKPLPVSIEEIEATPIDQDEDDEDDEVETIVWDMRAGLPEEEPTDRGAHKVPPLPPPRPTAPKKSTPPPRPAAKAPTDAADRETINAEAASTLTESTPSMRSPFALDDDPFPTTEATVSEERPITKDRSSANTIIVVLAILAVGLFGFAVFKYLQQQGLFGGSSSLTIQSTPPNAQLWLDGRSVSGQVDDVKPGIHLLEAKADNYNPYKEEIKLAAGEKKNVAISLKFVPAVIEFVVTPPDTIVKMDGKQVGDKSPVRLEDVLPGVAHSFAFVHNQFKPQAKTFTLKPRENRSETIVLEEETFDLDIDTDPSGARLSLNDKPAGKTPKTIKNLRATQQYHLEIKKRGYNNWAGTIIYDGKATKTVRLPLTPAADEQQSPPAPKSKPPAHSAPVKHKAASHRAPPKPSPKQAVSSADMGTLRLNSRPWGKVIVDGKDIHQNTPLPSYKLPAGAHTVTVKFNDGGEKTFSIDIFPGQVTKKIVKKEE